MFTFHRFLHLFFSLFFSKQKWWKWILLSSWINEYSHVSWEANGKARTTLCDWFFIFYKFYFYFAFINNGRKIVISFPITHYNEPLFRSEKLHFKIYNKINQRLTAQMGKLNCHCVMNYNRFLLLLLLTFFSIHFIM